MNNNTVSNPKTEVPSTPETNEKDILNDILLTEKYISDNYSTALNEASNDFLYNEFFKLFEESKKMTRETFDLLFKKGWYSLEKAEANKIEKEYQEYSNMAKEIKK